MGVIQFRRRTSGSTGAPSSLKSGEPAYNNMDNILYVGFGDDGNGNATVIKAVGGDGAFVDRSTAQTIGGTKTFSNSPIVPTPAGTTDAANKSYVDSQVSLKSNLNSPLFTGIPEAPTPLTSDDSARIATTAFVKAVTAGGVAGVSSFNTRTGAVTLTSGDVTTALGFSPTAVGHTHTAANISDSTSFGRGLLTAISAAAQRTLLELGAIAQKASLIATDISDSTSTGRSVLTAASAAAARTAIGAQAPATTLAGYGITNAYTKAEVDAAIAAKIAAHVATYHAGGGGGA
jgi:hypothetical protein